MESSEPSAFQAVVNSNNCGIIRFLIYSLCLEMFKYLNLMINGLLMDPKFPLNLNREKLVNNRTRKRRCEKGIAGSCWKVR